jgi:hypothetical protein
MILSVVLAACQPEEEPWAPDFAAGADCDAVAHASAFDPAVGPSLTLAALGDTLIYTPWVEDSETGQSVTTVDASTGQQELLGSVDIGENWHPWWAEPIGDRLWIGDYDFSNTGWSRLRVYDLSRPAEPVELARHELDDWTERAVLPAGDRALFSLNGELLAFDVATGDALGPVAGMSDEAVATWSGGVVGVGGDETQLVLSQYAWSGDDLALVGTAPVPVYAWVGATAEGEVAWVRQESATEITVTRWELTESGPVLTATWSTLDFDEGYETRDIRQANGVVYLSHHLADGTNLVLGLDATTLDEVGRWEWSFDIYAVGLGDDGRYWINGSQDQGGIWIGAVAFDFSRCLAR